MFGWFLDLLQLPEELEKEANEMQHCRTREKNDEEEDN